MRSYAIALAIVAGCSSGPTPADIHAGVMGYVEAAEKADATKTHADDSHPKAVAEMDRHEAALRKADADDVSADLEAKRSEWSKEKERIEQKANSLKVQGRELTPEETRWLEETAPREIRRLEFRMQTLDALKKRLGS